MLWMKTRQLAKWFKRQFCPVNSPPTNQHTVVDALASICAISAAAETITNIVFVLNSSKLWVSKLEQPENGCDKILRLGKKLICDQRPGAKRGGDETTRMWEVLQPLFTCTPLLLIWSPVSQTGMSHYEVAHHRRSAQTAKGWENVVIYFNALWGQIAQKEIKNSSSGEEDFK